MEETLQHILTDLLKEKNLSAICLQGHAILQTTGGEQVAMSLCTDAGTPLGVVQCRLEDMPTVAGKFLDELIEKLNGVKTSDGSRS